MKRARRRAVEAEVARLSVDLEQITPHDLRIINLALEDRARFHAGEPAGDAAEQVRAKIARNTRPR